MFSLEFDCVVHLSSKLIVQSALYQSWICSSFNSSTNHLYVGHGMSTNQSSFLASTSFTNNLHNVNPEIYSNLKISHSYTVDSQYLLSATNASTSSESMLSGDGCCGTLCSDTGLQVKAAPMLRYNLLPAYKRGWEQLGGDYNIYNSIVFAKTPSPISRDEHVVNCCPLSKHREFVVKVDTDVVVSNAESVSDWRMLPGVGDAIAHLADAESCVKKVFNASGRGITGMGDSSEITSRYIYDSRCCCCLAVDVNLVCVVRSH